MLKYKVVNTKNPTLNSDPRHILKVGQYVRLGGREGRIFDVVKDALDCNGILVRWDDDTEAGRGYWMDLYKFPEVEVRFDPPQITQNVADHLIQWAKDFYDGSAYGDARLLERFIQEIGDMLEVEK